MIYWLLLENLQCELHIQIEPQWVKDHYIGEHRELKCDLNDEADQLATSYQKRPHPQFIPTTKLIFLDAHMATIITGGSLITSKLAPIIFSNMYSDSLHETICRQA